MTIIEDVTACGLYWGFEWIMKKIDFCIHFGCCK